MTVHVYFGALLCGMCLACGPQQGAPAGWLDASVGSQQQHLIDGTPAAPHQFAAVGALVATDPRGRELDACTGTLIAPDLVLTAAHCLLANTSDGVQRHSSWRRWSLASCWPWTSIMRWPSGSGAT